ncbi:MAG: phasin family protein [Parvibaculaceae bacterium]|nr:phasin family protein [Parvibaculaceae bacterium]
MTETTAEKVKSTAKAASAAAAAKTVEAKNHFETASAILADLARTNYEEALETTRAVAKTKSPRDAFELQNELIRETFKRNVEAAKELNEISLAAARETFAPFTAKVTEFFDKMKAH